MNVAQAGSDCAAWRGGQDEENTAGVQWLTGQSAPALAALARDLACLWRD